MRYQSSPFARQLLRYMLRRRARIEHGDPDAQASPMLDHWSDGVYAAHRDLAGRIVEEGSVRLHSHAAALNSSMVFAFNLFLPFIKGEGLAGALRGVLGDVRVDRVQLEWVPPGALLGELDGDTPRPEEAATSIDAVVWAMRPDGRRLCVLVEVKLSESGFSPCTGKDSRNNTRPDVCASAETFFAAPTSCYLQHPLRQRRERRYWELFAGRHGSVPGAFPGAGATGACPFAGDHQQPMRQHALALAVEETGLADEAVLLLLHHDDNPDAPPAWSAYRDLVAEPHRIQSLAAGAFVAGASAHHPDWARYMSERYRLP